MTEHIPLYKKQKKSDIVVDKAVGSRVRLRRSIIGLSQRELAKEIGISFQQLQKYEKGANRISAGKLFELGQILNVPINFFFDDVAPKSQKSTKDKFANLTQHLVDNSDTLELVKNFLEVPKPLRKNLISLLKEMVKNEKGKFESGK